MPDPTSTTAPPTPRDVHPPQPAPERLHAVPADDFEQTLSDPGDFDAVEAEHLLVVDHVEDVLAVVGPQRTAEVLPGVKVSLAELPPARQRAVLAQILTWRGAQAFIPADGASTRGRVIVRFADRPQLTVAFAVTAVGLLRRTRPGTGPFVWALDEELSR